MIAFLFPGNMVLALGICGVIALLAAGVLAELNVHNRGKATRLGQDRKLLRSLIDNIPDQIFIKDMLGRFVIDNIAHARSLGAEDCESVIGKTVFDFVPRELAERFTLDDDQLLDSGTAVIGREEQTISTDGQQQWFATTKVPLRDGHGKLSGLVCISRDVTRQRSAQHELGELQKFLYSIFENIPDMIFVKDAEFLRFVRFNRAGEELLGIPRETMMGKNDYDLFPKEEADFFTGKDRAVLEGGKMMEIMAEEIQTSRGIRILHTKKIPLLDDAGKPEYLLGISSDVTEGRQAEIQLREKNLLLEESVKSEKAAYAALQNAQSRMIESEKLAALGHLVAGVAHEINNPLAFVSNNVAVLQRDLARLRELLVMYRESSEALRNADPGNMARIEELTGQIDLDYTLNNLPDLMGRTREGLRRIQEIVKDLREFSRQDGVGEFHEKVDINAGIRSTINIARGRARKNEIELVAELGELPGITCESAKINQVVLNLVVNAIDACNAGGKVTVRTRVVEEGVEIAVTDNGCGISPEIRGKIFDPFFTTKSQGEGTGLGLSISHGIIKEHGGSVEVISSAGEGATFVVRLPLRHG